MLASELDGLYSSFRLYLIYVVEEDAGDPLLLLGLSGKQYSNFLRLSNLLILYLSNN